MFGSRGGKTTARGKRGEVVPEPHDGLPDSEGPSGLCPRCMKRSSFESLGSIPVTFEKDVISHHPDGQISNPHVEQATVLLCRHCRHGIVVVEEEYVGGVHHSQSRGGSVTWRGIHWWPLPGAMISPDVPVRIGHAFDESVRAASAGRPRASAVMACRTLEAIADERGATDSTLAARLQSLTSTGKLHPSLTDWAKEVRLVGNRGAHFDPIEDVSPEDAKQLIGFVCELLRYVYELPAELNRRRSGQTP